jgi:hypothetical protein
MKKGLTIIIFFIAALHSFAQVSDTAKTWHIGIFANLYLDSAFSGKIYKYGGQMPRHILPGLDFAHSALMAFDSLGTTKKIKVSVYDVRSLSQSIAQLKTKNAFDSLDMMIGAVSGTDYRSLADIAFQKNIPFVSATFPNDGGVTNNPYTVIVNSTLPVHCEALYNFVLKTHPTENIIYLRKKGLQEDRLASYFANSNKGSSGSSLLKWKTINVTDSFSTSALAASLDSEKINVIIAGSLDEKFGARLISHATVLSKQYQLQLVGMPTWENLKEITKTEVREIPIYYSTTFVNHGTSKWILFNKAFGTETNGRPSDLAYKGYDITYLFTQLLLKHGTQMMKNLGDKSFKLLLDYDFRPVLNKTNGKPDYYENKRVYIMKRSNGLVSRMN